MVPVLVCYAMLCFGQLCLLVGLAVCENEGKTASMVVDNGYDKFIDFLAYNSITRIYSLYHKMHSVSQSSDDEVTKIIVLKTQIEGQIVLLMSSKPLKRS